MTISYVMPKRSRSFSNARNSKRPRLTGVTKKRKETPSASQRDMAIEILNRRTGGFVGRELKFLDSEVTATALTGAWANYLPSGTGCTDSISVPAVGTGESERIGRKYTVKSVHIRFRITIPGGESQTAPMPDLNVRVIVYWDRQTNKAKPAVTDIMDTGGTRDILAFRNLQTTTRFIVLMDKVIHISQIGATNEGAVNLFAIGDRVKNFKFNKKLTFDVDTVGTSANVTSVSDNNIGIQAIADSVVLAPTIEYQARVRFTG